MEILISEVSRIASGVLDYLKSMFNFDNAFWGVILATLNYLFIPNHFFAVAISSVIIGAIADIITKFYYYIVKCGGIKQAFWYQKQIKSDSLYRGTEKKAVTYCLAFILTVQCYRLANMIDCASHALYPISLFYGIMLFREAYSSFENLRDAGCDTQWVLDILNVRKKVLEDKIKKEEENE